MTAAAAFKIGVDIGGTFTDITIVGADGRVTSYKTPSTPRAPAEGVLRGIAEALQEAGRAAGDCIGFVHGSTIGVNTIIQRNGARVGVIVTKGFEDLLELGRVRMSDPFSLMSTRPIPLSRRNWVRGADERVSTSGKILKPLDETTLLADAKELITAGAEALTIIFVNAYRNPVHEHQARQVLQQAFPRTEIALSTELWPQVREYERATVAVMNSYIAPKVTRYLTELQDRKEQIGLRCPLYMTSSNGGIVPLTQAKSRPIGTLLSGPASGVVATLQLMQASNLPRVITMDVGGTSADLCVLEGDQIPYAWDQEIEGLPVTLPSVDVSSIGAGGGSIAYCDNVGLLRVGPQSAGADPGPVAYARGGAQPTVTDAYLVSGFIDPKTFLGGRLPLDLPRAKAAIAELGSKLRLGERETASGILQVATSSLAAEFSRLTAKKGIDAREFVLVPFGGAGATHACLLADEVHMQRIAIPVSPGTFCATGSILADFRLDFVRTLYMRLDDVEPREIDAWLVQVQREGEKVLQEASGDVRSIQTLRTAGIRYLGQGADTPISFTRLDELPASFRREYERLYGVRDEEAPLEVISIQATVIGVTQKSAFRWAGNGKSPTPRSARQIDLNSATYECPIYTRSCMPPGWSASGPFIVEQPDTTCVVTLGWNAEVDSIGTLHLTKNS